jgi:hypothetical protein
VPAVERAAFDDTVRRWSALLEERAGRRAAALAK